MRSEAEIEASADDLKVILGKIKEILESGQIDPTVAAVISTVCELGSMLDDIAGEMFNRTEKLAEILYETRKELQVSRMEGRVAKEIAARCMMGALAGMHDEDEKAIRRDFEKIVSDCVNDVIEDRDTVKLQPVDPKGEVDDAIERAREASRE